MPEATPNSYDEMPYINLPFVQTHPARLATLATLFGMQPPAVESCRVLELGCAAGDNLIPMALVLPGARFLGIDLSVRQIERGLQTIAALGLTNIELRHADIAAVDAAYGQFDYIIAHGIYSWVPTVVREKLLAVCHDNLVRGGIAYVSYNTLPGWTSRGMLRELMLQHSRQAVDAAARVRQSRAMLDFLSHSLPSETAYGALLRQEIDVLRQEPDAYLFHDHRETVNDPVYFHQFIAAAERHDLQFLAEAEYSMMTPAQLPAAIADGLSRFAADGAALQQYLDFLTNRTFRQTLLVHRDVALRRDLDGRSVQGFAVASPVRPLSNTPSLAPGTAETFRAPNGATFHTSSALAKAALLALMRQWPAAVPFAQLVAAARAQVPPGAGRGDDIAAATASDAQALGDEILRCYAAGVVELRLWSPRLSVVPTARPVASPLARLQAMHGEHVTNLLLQRVTLDGLTCVLLPLLDGTRDRGALVSALAALAARGGLHVQQNGQPLTRGAALEALLGDAVNTNLPRLAKAGLLVE